MTRSGNHAGSIEPPASIVSAGAGTPGDDFGGEPDALCVSSDAAINSSRVVAASTDC